MQVVGEILAQLRLCDSRALVSAFVDISAECFPESQVAESQVIAVLMVVGGTMRSSLDDRARFVGSLSADDAIVAGK